MSALNPESGIGKTIADARILAVLVIDDPDSGIPLAEALLGGGITVMELTLRTPAALAAAAKIRECCPEMKVGIGTILFPEQADAALDAGAHFGVSPGVNPFVIRRAASIGLPFGPGVMTPTEIDTAMQEGCRLLKFFPAESSGGLAHLKNIAAPFAHLGPKFVPLGGITLANMAAYLQCEHVAAVGGSWLAPRDLVRQKNWKAIENEARNAITALDS